MGTAPHLIGPPIALALDTQTPKHPFTMALFGVTGGHARPVSRKHSFMPGYGGSIQHEYNQIAMTFGKAARAAHTTASNNKANPRKKLDPRETFTANDFYARLPDPRRKTNSKNRSNLDLGDPRAQTFETMNMSCFRTRELPNPRAPLVEGFDEMTCEERDRIYRRALERTTITGVRKLESDIRMKIDQRTSGGPFALRKAFKYFDRDGSGDIDPDEFFDAMNWFGLQFTEHQVFALFGSIDEDAGGSIDYYEFIGKVIAQDYEDMSAKGDAGDALRPKCAPERHRSRAIIAYQQQLAIQDLFSQLESMQSGDKLVVPRARVHELLKLADVPECSRDQAEKHVDLVQHVLDMLSRGSISREVFWDWWAGTPGVIQGVANFPAGATSFSIVKPSQTHNELLSNGKGDAPAARSILGSNQIPKVPLHQVAPALSYRPGSLTARTAQLPRLDFHAVAAPSHNHPHTHRYHHPAPPNAAPIVAPPPHMTRRSLVFTNEGISAPQMPPLPPMTRRSLVFTNEGISAAHMPPPPPMTRRSLVFT